MIPDQVISLLVVEDDPGVALLEVDVLEEMGFTVSRAATGREALAALMRELPTLMLLDYSLPDMTAIELLDLLREQGLAVPAFIVATGAGDEHVAVDLMQRGAQNYLVKDHDFLDVLPPAVERALRDIAMARRLADAEKKLRLAARVLEGAAEAVILTDARHSIMDVNPAFVQITGFTLDEMRGKHPQILLARESAEPLFLASVIDALENAGRWQGEMIARRKSGEIFTAWFNVSRIEGDAGEDSAFVTLFSDISTVKASAEHLDYLAHHDPLTGLPNRLLFNARLAHSLGRAQRNRQGLGLLFLDLDHFKEVNDRLGHAAGDDLLCLLARRMESLLREEDTLARLGGDEFVVLIEDASDERELRRVVDQLLALFPHPVNTPQGVVNVSASIGGAVFPESGTTPESLLACADAAMYAAKDAGRNTFVMCDPGSLQR